MITPHDLFQKYTPAIRITNFEGIKLDIGCGEKKLKKDSGFIGLDIVDLGQELVWDIDCGLPIPDGTVERIFCHHTLEHTKNPLFVLNEFHRVLKKKGMAEIIVPDYKETGAYVLHHTRLFSEMSFKHLSILAIKKRYGIKPWKIIELSVGDEAWIDDYGQPTIHTILESINT